MNFKIIFNMDGRGVYFNPADPIHLDALLAWCLAPMQCGQKQITRDDIPEDVRLPLLRSRINGAEVWHASALFPDGPQFEGFQYWRKRFRQNRIELTSGSPNLTNGIYRDWNHPVPIVLCHRMAAYASGNRCEVKRILKKQLKYLGKKRAHGLGKIVSIEAEETPEDWSMVWENKAMRWLPHKDGGRLVRPTPPYWNPHGRVMCLEVGQEAASVG
jgi:hypothetical protein